MVKTQELLDAKKSERLRENGAILGQQMPQPKISVVVQAPEQNSGGRGGDLSTLPFS